eukprot:s1350_g3.t1
MQALLKAGLKSSLMKAWQYTGEIVWSFHSVFSHFYLFFSAHQAARLCQTCGGTAMGCMLALGHGLLLEAVASQEISEFSAGS